MCASVISTYDRLIGMRIVISRRVEILRSSVVLFLLLGFDLKYNM